MPGRTYVDGAWVQTGTWQEPNRKPRRNTHPTVKPLGLMRWLVRLVTPPGGTVLDPFAGSGTTGIAEELESALLVARGFAPLRFIGIEREPEYVTIARARIAWWEEHGEDGLRILAEREARERKAEQKREERAEAGQGSLFDEGQAA